MKDLQGNEITVGCRVAVAGQGGWYTGTVTKISDVNNWTTRYYGENARTAVDAKSREYALEQLDRHDTSFRILREDTEKKISIGQKYRLLVLTSPENKVE